MISWQQCAIVRERMRLLRRFKISQKILIKEFKECKRILKLKDWTFQIRDLRKVGGRANCVQKIIELSRHIFTKFSKQELINIFVHELAHACLHWTVGHGRSWHLLTRRLGGSGAVYCSIFYKPHANFECKCGVRSAWGPSKPRLCTTCDTAECAID